MSPAQQPPRPPGPPGKPGPGGGQRQPPPEHPAERGQVPGQPQRAGRYFEIRKGKARDEKGDAVDEEPPITNVALPRSITQEQEQADLKQRLGRDELVDIDKRSALVKVKDTVSEPASGRRRSNGIWLLLVVVAIALAALVADRLHLLPIHH